MLLIWNCQESQFPKPLRKIDFSPIRWTRSENGFHRQGQNSALLICVLVAKSCKSTYVFPAMFFMLQSQRGTGLSIFLSWELNTNFFCTCCFLNSCWMVSPRSSPRLPTETGQELFQFFFFLGFLSLFLLLLLLFILSLIGVSLGTRGKSSSSDIYYLELKHLLQALSSCSFFQNTAQYVHRYIGHFRDIKWWVVCWAA